MKTTAETRRTLNPFERAEYWSVNAPCVFLGVSVPEGMRPNWDTVELSWWRLGVRAALGEEER